MQIKNLIGNGSIKKRVIILVTSQLLIALLCVLAITFMLMNKQLNTLTKQRLVDTTTSLNQAIEQRLNHLIDNAKLLASNELMINALTDSLGRKAYLAPLVSNFMKGKDVNYLNIVDFDGHPIFQSVSHIPEYNQSAELRMALALSQSSVFIDDKHQLVVISPIEYYETTQGALIVSFDLERTLDRNIRHGSELYIKLVKGREIIFNHNHHHHLEYYSYQDKQKQGQTILSRLGVHLEVGLPVDLYYAPKREALMVMLTAGLILTIISVYISRITAIHITTPILELSSRVKQAHEGKEILCSPLGSGDELEALAKAFDERTLMLEYQAEHDSLTALPNRLLFMDRLQHAIKLAQRSNSLFAVLFLDLDRFKEVNDSYGHSAGDLLIQQIAQRIADSLRECDSVARMGGDEFTVLIDCIEHEADVSAIILKLHALFEAPITFDSHQFYLTCCIGAALYPADGQDADTLLKNADAAMYKAKSEGRNTYQFYTEELTQAIVQRVQLEQQMRQAIEENQFEVYFQPQYALQSNTIIGMEALLRWQHPLEGLLPPIKFIPLAEETGQIVEIDRLMMLSAMKAFMGWKKAGLNPGVLSMNLSMLQLAKGDFIEFTQNALQRYEIEVGDVMFEVTETQAMLKPEQTVVAMQQLKALGVGLAIDDFGTGFSSLSYLKQLPVDKIKIDRSFISDLPEDKDDVALTRAIIALSQSLNLTVLAEGIDEQVQVDFLLKNNCFEGQGYLFSKPVTGEQMKQLMKNATEHQNIS